MQNDHHFRRQSSLATHTEALPCSLDRNGRTTSASAPANRLRSVGGLINPFDIETERKRRREDITRYESYAPPPETLALRIALWRADELTRRDNQVRHVCHHLTTRD